MITSKVTLIQYQNQEIDIGTMCMYTSTSFYCTCRFMSPPLQSIYRTVPLPQRSRWCHSVIVTPTCLPLAIPNPWQPQICPISLMLPFFKMLYKWNHLVRHSFEMSLFPLRIMPLRSIQVATRIDAPSLLVVEWYSVVWVCHGLFSRRILL